MCSSVDAVCKALSKGLQGSSSLQYKICLWRFHKGHKQAKFKSQRSCSMPMFEIQPVESKQSSQCKISTCMLFAKLVSKVMYILNIRYDITEKDLSSCHHMNPHGL